MFGQIEKHSYPGDQRGARIELGWAPGDYTNECRECGELFTGDKRAYRDSNG